MTRRVWGVVLAVILAGAVPTSAQELDASKIVFAAGPTQTAGSGAPSASEPAGSFYYRTDTGQWYVRIGSSWVTLIDSAGKIPALSSTYFSSLSGANLTSLPAGQLTGTITSATQDLITRTGTVTSGVWNAGAVTSSGLVNAASGFTSRAGAGTVGGVVHFYLRTAAGAARWNIGLQTAESSGNAGSDFRLWSYDDTGAFLRTNLQINRATGAGVFTGTLGVTELASLNGGIAVDTDKFTVADTTGNTVVGGTLGVTGAATFSSTISSSLIPTTTDAYDLGRYDKLWDEGFISTLNAVVFKESTQTIFGGYSTIGKQAGSFAADVAAAAATIDFGQAMVENDWVLVRAHDTGGAVKAEYIRVLTPVSGTTYNVTRDLAGAHGTDPAWASGTPFLVLGAEDDGRIDLLAYDGKPRAVFTQQGATYSAQNDRAVVGNLNGYYGYATDLFGFAAGDASAANITIDPTNGVRVRHGTTDKITLDASGNAAFSGAITSTSGTIGGWTLGANSLTGGNATLASSGNLTLGTGDDVLRASADDATYRLWIGDATAADAPFSVTKAGVVAATGATFTGPDITLTSPTSFTDSAALKFARTATGGFTGTGDRVALWSQATDTGGTETGTLMIENTMIGTENGPGGTFGDAFLTLTATGWVPTGSGSAAPTASLVIRSRGATNATDATLTAQSITLTGAVSTSSTITERGRSTPMGEWTAVTYAAGDFTANDSMTWTVDSGDVGAYAYTLVGKTMTVAFTIDTSTVGGTPSTQLRIAIPGGFAAGRTVFASYHANQNGTVSQGMSQVASGGTTINLFVNPVGSTNWSAATNTTTVRGQITFEVQ